MSGWCQERHCAQDLLSFSVISGGHWGWSEPPQSDAHLRSLYVDWRCIVDRVGSFQSCLCSLVWCLLILWIFNITAGIVSVSRLFPPSLSLSFHLSLYLSYSGFTAVAFLKFMIDQEHLPISLLQWDLTLRVQYNPPPPCSAILC